MEKMDLALEYDNKSIETIFMECYYTEKTDIDIREKIYLFFKRLFDIVFSLTLLIVAVPLIFIFGILIKLESNGSIFYKQDRVGLYGKTFTLVKLRSMYIDAEKNGARWASKNDSRVTRVGKFIRLTRIDELPQILNVLRGEMSIIGPRPERPGFTYQFEGEIPGFIKRVSVKPGLTGWAQVNGGYDITPEEKYKFDMFYINNRNTFMDIKILFRTVKVVLTGQGAR